MGNKVKSSTRFAAESLLPKLAQCQRPLSKNPELGEPPVDGEQHH